jgi:hypothetical protein
MIRPSLGKGGGMPRSHRLLPILLVVALGAGTGCTAVGYSVGAGVSEVGGEHSGRTPGDFAAGDALQSPPAASSPDTTAGVRDSSQAASPATDTAQSKPEGNRTLVVIAVLAVVAGFIFLVAR